MKSVGCKIQLEAEIVERWILLETENLVLIRILRELLYAPMNRSIQVSPSYYKSQLYGHISECGTV